MKQVIRYNTFETNSSSCHSLAIPKPSRKKRTYPNVVHFGFGEFGWEFDEVDPADYLYTALYDIYSYDNSEELEKDKREQQEFILEVLTFIFKNVSPVFIILILGLIALHNFGNIFKTPKPEVEEVEDIQDDTDILPSFDPYLALQNNSTNTDDFFQQETQFTSVVDKKKSEIINSILGDPEEAARILTSYIKE